MTYPNGRSVATPVIIVGAARSGTNMLRDALTQIPGAASWPCDEINPIWRHHWAAYPTDELRPHHATPRVRRYIRAAFSRLANRTNARWVVEKTCANSLRVDFVQTVFPEAKFVFLLRDGRDVAASALKRWTAKPDWRYLARKARHLPLGDTPYYALRYLRYQFYRARSKTDRYRTWGPRFEGIDQMLLTHPLLEVCAEQWRQCVVQSHAALIRLAPERVCYLRYEVLAARPQQELQRVSDFIGVSESRHLPRSIAAGITSANTGKWRNEVTPHMLAAFEPRILSTLEEIETARLKRFDEQTARAA